ncbi:Tol-Pal system beta propeller repeat protein TolB [candidate division WOR-3 bacterium JGI_Cruoil_03_51_56]|uniref:Tol-Pal system beta propeller repeat protein TolB n=1 Tax=candidate division WOR-3 bacterium JGI_Cruoil_03_51_56 TaxID=1973747 RepID=A0A235BUC1_UNCW3|nr:MAG: Tol-Pal system beta propeller repeat protein TolB [candidate division WOR-3 bacterium JGI_Cruoil_03_51_56]
MHLDPNHVVFIIGSNARIHSFSVTSEMKRVICWLALLGISLVSGQNQQDELWLRITATSGRQRLNLVIAEFSAQKGFPKDTINILQSIQQVFEADLRFSLYFTFQQPESGAAFGFETAMHKVDLKAWGSTGAEVLICGDLTRKRSGPILQIWLYDLLTCRRIATKPYRFRKQWRRLAHEIADDVIKLLTGEQGVSRTRIAFSRSLGNGRKELALLDYDGAALVSITNSGGVKLFPDFSPDGNKLAYCAYGKHSLNIYTLDIQTRKRKTLSERPGLNTTPAWSPDNKTIAVSLSFRGQSDIYLMDPKGHNLSRLTTSHAIDISPTWSPSGRQLAFVSDRTGTPQVYIMNADGIDLHRLTFEGSYNTSPAWSPRGDMVAFVQRQPDGSNQVCATNITGDTYLRLTSRGSNEDPIWSPDGLHIAFSSNRSGHYEIYTMDWNGAHQKCITRTKGAFSPTWSH